VYALAFTCNDDFEDVLYRIGAMPLPPYIQRAASLDDRLTYQTVYASRKGAVAAPTAGLHFSTELLERIKAKGIQIVEITLHVGPGTFLPVRVEDIRRHRMHSERYDISQEAAAAIRRAKRSARRVIAVGTTCVRTLEHVSDPQGYVRAGSGSTDLFIYPGYRFKAVDAMLTNFHLPGSTLLMLVSAFAGKEKVLAAYRTAINERYRFYSYGDAMLII
jgi:S-adenosylmethionine:tRNA ribosyltransferase-isomerase